MTKKFPAHVYDFYLCKFFHEYNKISGLCIMPPSNCCSAVVIKLDSSSLVRKINHQKSKNNNYGPGLYAYPFVLSNCRIKV